MTWKKPTAGIILAAGMSTRLGIPKQLLKIGGRYLINMVVDASLNSNLENVILVLGHCHAEVLQTIGDRVDDPRLEVAVNHNYEEGLSSSLRCGFSKVKLVYPSVMFLLGDQPLLNSETIDHMLKNFWSSKKDICVPICRGRRKNPTLFSQKFYDKLLDTSGDIGARTIIKTHPESVLSLEIDDYSCFLDIDTQDDLEMLESLILTRETTEKHRLC